MKKLILFAVCAMSLTACDLGKKSSLNTAMLENDSLRAIIEARDNEINDMMGTLNDIQEGFRAINEAEDRLTISKDDEGANASEQIKDEISFIAERMNENRELIKKLQQQLRETGFKGDQMRKTIEQMTVQLEKKDRELKALREELNAKNIHISELDEAITNLNTDVQTLTTEKEKLTTEKTNLQNENTQKSQTISTQDKQLNTAWYVFGTKKELKEQKILDEGKVLQGSFNKNYFTKIDIRVDKEIKLYSKGAQILTSHPAGSYTLAKDTSGQYVLRISDPTTFWSTSKYLVVQVK